MDNRFIELKENIWAISKANYESLPINESGLHQAIDVPNGTQLEVFNETSGKIEIYAEAINSIWYER